MGCVDEIFIPTPSFFNTYCETMSSVASDDVIMALIPCGGAAYEDSSPPVSSNSVIGETVVVGIQALDAGAVVFADVVAREDVMVRGYQFDAVVVIRIDCVVKDPTAVSIGEEDAGPAVEGAVVFENLDMVSLDLDPGILLFGRPRGSSTTNNLKTANIHPVSSNLYHHIAPFPIDGCAS